MEKYAREIQLEPRATGIGPGTIIEGQLSRLEGSLKGLYELRSRLAGLNITLRGAREENATEKPPAQSTLASIVAQINSLVEQCHCELNEATELLR